MVIPFFYQYPLFHPIGRSTQMGGILLILFIFLMADFVCARKFKSDEAIQGSQKLNWWLVGGCLVFIIPVLIHLSIAPQIPLWATVVNGVNDPTELLIMRERAVKLLDTSPLLKYWFNWAIVVIAPATVALAFYMKKNGIAIFLWLISIVYAIMALAKAPVILLVGGLLVATAFLRPRWGRWLMPLAISSLILFGVIGGIVLKSDTYSLINYVPPSHGDALWPSMSRDDPRRAVNQGDIARLRPLEVEYKRSYISRKVEYLIYRAFLGPSDVSNRWYQYFIYRSPNSQGLHGLLPWGRTEGEVAPSREVGLWAYQERFPEKYMSSINAYASMDADAYSRGGFVGVLYVTILAAFVRLLACFIIISHPLSKILYGIILSGYCLLPASGSLQAVLGSNGLIFAVLLMLLLWMDDGKYFFRNRKSELIKQVSSDG